MKKSLVLNTLDELPEEFSLDELISLLENKSKDRMLKLTGTSLATERTLAKDWDRPEEDRAWKGL